MRVEHVIEKAQHNEKVNNLPLFHSMKSIGELGPIHVGQVYTGHRILDGKCWQATSKIFVTVSSRGE
jgi:hypothetical protein